MAGHNLSHIIQHQPFTLGHVCTVVRLEGVIELHCSDNLLTRMIGPNVASDVGDKLLLL